MGKKLRDFVQFKQDRIKEVTGIDYVDEDDLEWCMQISDGREDLFFGGIDDCMIDIDICPWCFMYISCDDCSYGKKYGVCMHDNSKYDDIASHDSSICFIIGVNNILDFIKNYKDGYEG